MPSDPFDKNDNSNQISDVHPLQWVIDLPDDRSVVEVSHSTPEANESARSIVQVEVLVHQSADPVSVVTDSQSAGGVAHHHENSAQHINIDFESPNKSVFNTSKDPMVSQTFSDLDTAEILAALNEDIVEIT